MGVERRVKYLQDIGEPDKSFTLHGVERFFDAYDTTAYVEGAHTTWGKAKRKQEIEKREWRDALFGANTELTTDEFTKRLQKASGQKKTITPEEAERYADQLGFSVVGDRVLGE